VLESLSVFTTSFAGVFCAVSSASGGVAQGTSFLGMNVALNSLLSLILSSIAEPLSNVMCALSFLSCFNIKTFSERMSDLINLLFEYVRLDSANYGLRREDVDLPELLRTIAADLYSDVEEKGMEFEICIPEVVKMVSVDRVQFSRVIVNLINNAIKHNKAGTTITLEMKQEKGKTQIMVSDNGSLIPKFLAEQIFEPFAMGDASRTAQSGSGLGLSIAKKIVEMHGWTLELKQYYEENKKAFAIEIN
jgi:signal transduction histidine kinase